jgi:hypothetical protein
MHIRNATGSSLPPLYVFEGKRRVVGILNGAPIGAVYAMSTNGYFTEENFIHVIHFINKHTPSTPRLFIIDGHTSHFEPSALDLCVQSDIQILCLPAHTSHLLQVADLTVFGPFKKRMEESCESYRLKNNHDINKYDIAAITAEPWLRSVSPSNVIAGFKKSGIWPLNKLAIPSEKYLLQLSQTNTTTTTATTTTTILSVPSTTYTKQKKPPKQYLNTNHAVLLTDEKVLDMLHTAEKEKQEALKQQQQRKREREEKQLDKKLQQRLKQQNTSSRAHVLHQLLHPISRTPAKRARTTTGKENTPPATSTDDLDPYAHNAGNRSTPKKSKTSASSISAISMR